MADNTLENQKDNNLEIQQREENQRLNAQLSKKLHDWDLLMSISEVCIVKIDLRDFSFIEYNDVMYRMLGLTREEYESKYHHSMAAFFNGPLREELDKLTTTVTQSLEKGLDRFSLRMRMPSEKGLIWIGGAASFTDYDPVTHQPAALYAVYRDITDIVEGEKKQAQAEVEIKKNKVLRHQGKKMRRMIDGVPSGLGALRIIGGAPAETIQLNRYFCERIDVDVDANSVVELYTFLQCIHPEDRQQTIADFKAFLQNKNLMDCQYRFRTLQGNYIWTSVRGTTVPINDAKEIAYFIFTDIDALKATETQLVESRADYQRTVDALQIAMWTYDIPGRRIFLGDNAATEALRRKYRWPQIFENVPESLLETIEEEDRENYLAMFRKIQAGQDATCDVWYKQQTGLEPHCERESYHVVCDDDGRPIKAFGVGINVTAEKKVEERYVREMEYLRNNSDESLIAKGHYNLTQNLVLEYDSRIARKIYTFKPGIPYDEAYGGMLAMSYREADRREIADKLKRENLIRRYQRGEMHTTLQ